MMLEHILEEPESTGLLLKTDLRLPNVCAMVAGEPVSGSWWSHPKSHEIFQVLCRLSEHPDVLVTKLVSGKDTFVHRRLWPCVLSIGLAREPWQMRPLSVEDRDLLARVDREGDLVTMGRAAAALEKALLVHGEQVHTDAGSHGKRLRSWRRWMECAGVEAPEISVSEARESIAKLLTYLNTRFHGRGRLAGH